MKVYVLTSHDIERLSWIEKVIPQRETVVVINSLDPDYGAVASKWCEERGYEHHVTKSDGTPATGKNSVIKLFLESEEDYMVHVDGDDLLTPYGYKLYKAVAESGKAPDCISIYRHIQINPITVKKNIGERYDKLFSCINVFERDETWKKYWGVEYPNDRSEESPQLANLGNLYNVFRQDPYNAEPNVAMGWAKSRHLFNHYIQNYSDAQETMLRMVFFSRKCAEKIQYDHHFTIGEDTLQWFLLKGMSQKGEIDMQRRKERYNPTYISTKNTDSIMLTVGLNNYDWIKPFNEEIQQYKREGRMPERMTVLKEFNDGTYL